MQAVENEDPVVLTPDQLKRFLVEAGRTYLVINSLDLVDSLSWPEGVTTFQRILEAYRVHREATPTGETEIVDVDGTPTRVPTMKQEQLSKTELHDAIAALQAMLDRLE